MIVKGTPQAKKILHTLKHEVTLQSLSPKLAIIYAGDDPASERYLERKRIAGSKCGVEVVMFPFKETEQQECLQKIQELNANTSVHGIIVQLPVYSSWDTAHMVGAVHPAKDVDGFLPDSPYTEATANAIWEMLYQFAYIEGYESTDEFLQGKKIAVLGRGRTAGGPAIRLLEKKGYNPTVITSQTENPDEITRQADVIITAVGKEGLIHAGNIKDGVYVVNVGIDVKEVEGETQYVGDIVEEEIARIARLYCPALNGVGPLTVACLLNNVVMSAKNAAGTV